MQNRAFRKLLELARTGVPIRTHSGKVEKGDIFVALPGTRVDGAQYIPQALQKGASYVVTRNLPPGLEVQEKIIIHPHPAQALGELASAYFGTENLKAKIIGITGTNGKTTTTYLLEHLLAKNGFRVGVIGTVNYRWPGKEYMADMTTPDCLRLHHLLARMDKDGVDFVCMEVSSHALDQNRVAGIDFDYAVFTNLTQDHLDYHLNLEDYFQAKAKLFRPENGQQPQAVINGDDISGKRLKKIVLDSLCYGLDEDANDLIATSVLGTRYGLQFECKFKNRQWRISSSLIGRFNVYNLLAAVGVGLKLGFGETELKELEDFQGVPGRLQRIHNKKRFNIFIDYAHTPDALENVCRTLKGVFEHLVVLFGCGGNRDKAKRPLMGEAVARYADMAIITSDNPRDEEPELIIRDILPGIAKAQSTSAKMEIEIEPDRKKAIKLAISKMAKAAKAGDSTGADASATVANTALLIAGKGHEDYQEIKGKKFPFHDGRVVEEIIDAYDC